VISKKIKIIFYSFTFLISCVQFFIVCRHNLGFRVDDSNIFYLVHVILSPGIVFFFNIILSALIQYLYKLGLNFKRVLVICISVLTTMSIAFYLNSFLVDLLPVHLGDSFLLKKYPTILSGNKIYFEQTLPLYSVIFIWHGMYVHLWIFIEEYNKKVVSFYRNKKRYTDSQLSLLRKRMNPHFLFNELNNIYALSVLNKPNFNDYLRRSNALVKSIADEKFEHETTLEKEILAVENYIQLQKIRYGDSLKISQEIPTKLGNFKLPSMTLLTLVENSVKHCDIEKEHNGFHIVLKLKLENNQLHFKISNTYIRDKKQVGGIGISQLEERLQYHFDHRYQLIKITDDSLFNMQLIINYTT